MRGLKLAQESPDHLAHWRRRKRSTACYSDAFTTLEVAFKANSQDVIYRLNVLTLRGNLWLKRGRSETADADFREAITQARKMKALAACAEKLGKAAPIARRPKALATSLHRFRIGSPSASTPPT
jgi:hypothetical protein